jgi:hypothetical protein
LHLDARRQAKRMLIELIVVLCVLIQAFQLSLLLFSRNMQDHSIVQIMKRVNRAVLRKPENFG